MAPASSSTRDGATVVGTDTPHSNGACEHLRRWAARRPQNDTVTLDRRPGRELCTRLAATGLKRIEAVSFVHPKLVPQMAGAEEVFAHLPPPTTASRTRASSSTARPRPRAGDGGTEIHVAYPVTDTFAQRNQNVTVERGGDDRRGDHQGHRPQGHGHGVRGVRLPVRGQGRPGPRDRARPSGWPKRRGRGDPRGHDRRGRPQQVAHLVPEALKGGKPVGLHLHNTRNTGYANAYAGLEHGATVFDASVGGTRRLPVCAARDRQHRHRGSRLPARERRRHHRD